MTDLLNHQIDQYRIAGHIARGGMADVYLAHDDVLERQVALKVMRADIDKRDEFTIRFQREARAVARLQHPNIIQIYTAGITPQQRPYLAMQYVPGGTLKDWIRRLAERQQRLKISDSLALIRQLADALDTAHRAGIVHRDLKPSNILLQKNGTPVLTDLGIAAVQTGTQLTRTDMTMGTPHYMSPEQAQGQRVDGRSDLYSLGIILYELLSGAPPFNGDSPLAVMNQHVNEPPPPLQTVRPGLATATYQVVHTCLQKEAAQRYQSAAELVLALDDALIAEGASGLFKRGETVATRTAPSSETQPGPPTAATAQPTDVPPAISPDEETRNTPSVSATVTASKRQARWGVLIAAAVLLLLLVCGGGAYSLYQLFANQPGADAPLLPEPPQIIETPTETAVLPSPTPRVSPAATAVRLGQPPAIDGSLDDWPAAAPILSAFRVYQDDNWDGADDLTAVWRLGWDDAHLYVGVTVADDVHVQTQTGNQLFRGDSVDMQLATNRGDGTRTQLNTGDFQITFSPGDFNALPPSAFLFRGTADNRMLDAPGGHTIRVAARQTADGYVLEAAIPWADLNVTPTAGLTMGAALNATDNDTPGTAVQEAFYSHVITRTFRDPSTWGTLTLAE